jgi:hypothetical protein
MKHRDKSVVFSPSSVYAKQQYLTGSKPVSINILINHNSDKLFNKLRGES